MGFGRIAAESAGALPQSAVQERNFMAWHIISAGVPALKTFSGNQYLWTVDSLVIWEKKNSYHTRKLAWKSEIHACMNSQSYAYMLKCIRMSAEWNPKPPKMHTWALNAIHSRPNRRQEVIAFLLLGRWNMIVQREYRWITATQVITFVWSLCPSELETNRSPALAIDLISHNIPPTQRLLLGTNLLT